MKKLVFLIIIAVAITQSPSGIPKSEDMYDARQHRNAVANEKFFAKWVVIPKSNEESVIDLLDTLWETDEGKALIRESIVRVGGVSKNDLAKNIKRSIQTSFTDNIITRKIFRKVAKTNAFSRADIEKKERSENIVYIKESLSVYSALLDLSHELTHLAFKNYFNPYDVDFNFERFYYEALEGDGGELRAIINECKVAMDLYKKYSIAPKKMCKPYYAKDGGINITKLRKDFFKVGEYQNEILAFLEKNINNTNHNSIIRMMDLISDDTPVFISGQYKLPYPISVKKEYEQVVQAARVNNCAILKQMNTDAEKNSSFINSISAYVQKFCGNC